MKRTVALMITAVLLTALCIPVFAADTPPLPPDGGFGPPPGGSPGGPGGPGSAGQEFAAFDEIISHAGIYIGSGMTGEPEHELSAPAETDFIGHVTNADGSGGTLSGGRLSGVRLDGSTGSNGIAIDLGSEDTALYLGGSEDNYTVDGEGYNSVIQVDAGQSNNDAGYEAIHGVGVAVNSGTLFIENSFIRSEGPRSTPVYMFSTRSPEATSLVVRNSHLEARSDEIWMPPFKLLAGGARASLLMTRNNSWFFDSEVISNNWGAISQDSVDAMTYVVNSRGVSTEGGYGTYLTYGMRLYGSELYGGQYGVFMCGESDIATGNGGAALEDAEAMRQAAEGFVPEERDSVIAAPCNAIVVHNSLPNLDMVAHGLFRSTVLSTSPEDLPAEVSPLTADDGFFLPGVDILGSGAGCGASYFYLKNLYGSLALIRSMNADLTFDGAVTKAENGVLLQSVVTYDPPAASGYLTPEQGGSVPGISATFLHGRYDGDILHQDYQRPMFITIGEDGTLTGKMVSGTYAAWNDLWSEEHLRSMMEADGHDPAEFGNELWVEDVQANLVRPEDTAYAGIENYGISLSLESGGTWEVLGDSSLKSLTLAEGAELIAPEGFKLEVFTGCSISNDALFYDESAAAPLEAVDAGTYENVVIRLEELPREAAEEAETPASSVEASEAPAEPEKAPAEGPASAEPEPALADPQGESVPSGNGALPVIAGCGILVIAGAAVAMAVIKKRK